MTLGLSAIRVDDDLRVRVAVDPRVVEEYARLIKRGTRFPPIDVFADDLGLYVADGQHRYLAHEQAGRTTIEAELRPGTKADALWYALGANKSHGKRLTERDVRHAIELAIKMWPERTGLELSEHIGCSQGYVSKVRHQTIPPNTTDTVVRRDGRTIPASYPRRVPPVHPLHDQIVERVKAGESSTQIRAALHARPELIAAVRRELGVGKPVVSKGAVRDRHERMRVMAAEGHTSRQIAVAIGLSEETCRGTLRKLGIDVVADRLTRGLHHHDANRIVSRIVLDAENLLEGLGLIDYRDLERAQIADWLTSLKKCREQLSTFIRRLGEEKSHNGEAA